MSEEPSAQGKVRIDADPQQVYDVVSDPVLMASLAAEINEVKWRGTARSQVGAVFIGRNRNGWRRWTTKCEVTDADPGRLFAYDVTVQGLIPIAHWRYDIEPDGDGSVVTERSWARAPQWFLPLGSTVTGITDRAGANQTHIEATLENLKKHCERETVGG